MKFPSLDLHPDLQKAIKQCGYSVMTPIQEKAIIPARRGCFGLCANGHGQDSGVFFADYSADDG